MKSIRNGTVILHIVLLLLLPAALGASTRSRNTKKPVKENKEINICDLQSHGSPLYCFCNNNQIRNATDVNCLIFAKFEANDPVWSHFTSQIYAEKLTFKVKEGGSFTYVPTSVLKQLRSLHVVIFQYTTIETLVEHAFSNHSSIAEIRLNRNSIVSLRKYAFENMKNLTLINLDENRLTEINRDVFINLPSMKQLFLNQNNISLLHDKAFKHLTTLEELQLSGNQIAVITRDSFNGLSSLLKLDLRNNLISMIGDNTFIEMPELQELELDQNQIKYISENALEGMRNLKKLRLSENKLVTLEPDFLNGAPNVYFLDLRDNALTTMTFDNVKPIVANLYDSTSYFYLDGNKLICDCKLAWIWGLRNETKNQKLREYLQELTCFLESNVTQKSHDDAERIQALESARNPENFITEHLEESNLDGDYMGDVGDYYDVYNDGIDGKHHNSGSNKKSKIQTVNGKVGYLKHLYELKLEDLPCVEPSREDLMASEQPSGRHANSAVGSSSSIFSSLSSGKILYASQSVLVLALLTASRFFT